MKCLPNSWKPLLLCWLKSKSNTYWLATVVSNQVSHQETDISKIIANKCNKDLLLVQLSIKILQDSLLSEKELLTILMRRVQVPRLWSFTAFKRSLKRNKRVGVDAVLDAFERKTTLLQSVQLVNLHFKFLKITFKKPITLRHLTIDI